MTALPAKGIVLFGRELKIWENVNDATQHALLRRLPGMTDMLGRPEVAELIDKHGSGVVTHAARQAIAASRARALEKGEEPDPSAILADTAEIAQSIGLPSLTPVINATGVVLHTNLGRAPLGASVIEEISRIAAGYSNLEFDLPRAQRGRRDAHVRNILTFLTGAEDVVVVNNNAAGIILALNTLAREREVIVSRGELIEIGGSFRIPEIMSASGACMVEVGATNRTRLADYEKAITDKTALIFKAHKSNYTIKGFTEETSVRELADLARARGLPVMLDIGSGLLCRPAGVNLENEPDIKDSLAEGADLVAFSGDKLLGGPQAGIVVGRRDLIRQMSKAPLMRAMRVGKLTLAALSAACRSYLNEKDLLTSNPTFAMLSRSPRDLDRLASQLVNALKRLHISARAESSFGQCGGGARPDLRIRSVAVEALPQKSVGDPKQTFAERLFKGLLRADPPVLGILREGKILFDVLTIFEKDIPTIAKAIADTLSSPSTVV